MKSIWKIVLVAGLLLAILALSGCFPLASTSTSGNSTSTASQSTWDSLWPMLIFLVVIFAMFYFVMIRPQKKRQKEHQAMMEGMQKGDRIITAGGIYGTIESVGEDNVVIKVEGGTTLRVNKASVALRRDESNPTVR